MNLKKGSKDRPLPYKVRKQGGNHALALPNLFNG